MRMRVFMSTLLALCLVLMTRAIADEGSACLVSEWGLNHTRGTFCFTDITCARNSLAAYNSLLAATPLEDRDSGFLKKVTELRCSILQDALVSYYFIGQESLPPENGSILYDKLMHSGIDYTVHYEMPDDLLELVEFGYLPHLPESSYASGQWLSEIPETAPEPGSLLYIPITAETAYMSEHAGENEGWLLIAYGGEKDRALSADSMRDSFMGNLGIILPVLPETALFLWGQDVNTIE